MAGRGSLARCHGSSLDLMFSAHYCGFPGELPQLSGSPHLTASHGTSSVSFISAWQAALLGREGCSENHCQAGPLGHKPVPHPSTTVRLPLLPLHGPGLWPQLSPLTPSDLDKHSSPAALGLCPALCMGLIEPLSLSEEKAVWAWRSSQLSHSSLQGSSLFGLSHLNPLTPSKCTPGWDLKTRVSLGT